MFVGCQIRITIHITVQLNLIYFFKIYDNWTLTLFFDYYDRSHHLLVNLVFNSFILIIIYYRNSLI